MRLGLPTLGLTEPRRGVAGGGYTGAIYNVSKIAAGINALNNSGSSRAHVTWVGHSIISGVGSDDTTNQNFTAAQTWRNQCIAAKVADAIVASRGGAVGRGVETLAINHAGYFTLGGAATISATYTAAGVNGLSVVLSLATHTVTVTSRGSAVRFYCYSTAAGTVARYQVNGGSIQNAPAAPATGTGFGARVWYEIDVTGLAVSDTVTLLGASSGTYVLYAADLDYKTTPGVTINRMAYSGYMLAQVTGSCLDGTDTNPTGQWTNDANEAVIRAMQGQSSGVRQGSHLVIVTTDINDLKAYGNASTPWSWSLATHKRHMKNLAQFYAGYSIPVLIVCGTLRDPATTIAEGAPYNQDDLIAQYKVVSDEEPNVAFLDWTLRYAGATIADRFAAQVASGHTIDDVHPNSVGCLDLGNYTAAQLLA